MHKGNLVVGVPGEIRRYHVSIHVSCLYQEGYKNVQYVLGNCDEGLLLVCIIEVCWCAACFGIVTRTLVGSVRAPLTVNNTPPRTHINIDKCAYLPHSYIFMDSEGLGSTDQDQTFDTQIFSLAVLLSSLFVFNTKSVIDEKGLEDLDLVVQCSKRIRATDDDEAANDGADSKASADVLASYFPRFLWVLRDFMLEMVDDDGNEITSKQYLEQNLRPVQSKRSSTQHKNRIRSTLSSVFPQRDCVALVRPLIDERQIRNLHQNADKLRPEFVQQMQMLSKKIYDTAGAKTVDGQFVNGPALVGLAEVYAASINEGRVPVISSAWQSIVREQAQQAMQAAVSAFTEGMKSVFHSDDVVLDSKQLQQHYEAVYAQSVQVLRGRAVGEMRETQELERAFRARTTEMMQVRVQMNDLRSTQLCQNLIQSLWKESGLANTQFTDAEALRAAIQQVVHVYNQRASGPAKHATFNAFVEEHYLALIGRVFKRCKSAEDKLVSLEEDYEQMKQENDRLSVEYSALEKSHITTVAELTSKTKMHEQLRARMEDVRAELASVKEEGKNATALLATANQQLASIKLSAAESKNELKYMKKDVDRLTAERKEAQAESLRKAGTIAQQSEDLTALAKQKDRLSEELNRVKIGAQEAKMQLQNSLRDEKSASKQLKAECDAQKKNVKALEKELRALEKEKDGDKTAAGRQISELDASISKCQREIESLERQLERSNADRDAVQAQLREEGAKAKQRLQAMQLKTKDAASLESKYQSAMEECMDLQSEVKALKDQMKKQGRSSKKELESETKRLIASEKLLEKESAANSRLLQRVDEGVSLRKDLERELDEMKKTHKSAQTQIKRLEAEMKSKTSLVNKLNREGKSQQKETGAVIKEAVADANKALKEAEKRAAKAEKSQDEWEEKFESQENMMDEMRKENKNLKKDVTSLNKQVKAAEKKAASAVAKAAKQMASSSLSSSSSSSSASSFNGDFDHDYQPAGRMMMGDNDENTYGDDTAIVDDDNKHDYDLHRSPQASRSFFGKLADQLTPLVSLSKHTSRFNHGHDDASVSSFSASPSAGASAEASRKKKRKRRSSFMPMAPQPEKCTIQGLKSWLTALDVDIPQDGSLKKQHFIELVYTHDPLFEGMEAPQPKKKKGRKRR